MNENKDKFTQDAIDKAKCYLETKGLIITLPKTDVIYQNSTSREINVSEHNESLEDTVLINKINQSNINI